MKRLVSHDPSVMKAVAQMLFRSRKEHTAQFTTQEWNTAYEIVRAIAQCETIQWKFDYCGWSIL